MESDLQPQQRMIVHDHQNHLHQQQSNPGLTRYRSAPSSYFTNILDREFSEQIFSRPLSPETERIFAQFMNSGENTEDTTSQNLVDIPKNTPVTRPETITETSRQPQYMPSPAMSNEAAGVISQKPSNLSTFSSASQSSYNQFTSKPPLPNQNLSTNVESASPLMNRLPPLRTGGGRNPNLVRHSSSPAGFFSQFNVERGYGALRGIGNFGAQKINEEPSFSSASRPNNFSSRMPSSPGLMSPIAEIDDKNILPSTLENEGFSEGFPFSSWDDSAAISDDITGRKRFGDGNIKSYSNSTSETQNVEAGNRPQLLAYHLSLPKTAAEMSAIEKFLQFSDSIPCKIRAKRGCATHPRSIAERVRRTRISERMRKLQELVPNMDKQTNTSDMLDLAVEYIKDLQKQVQTLTDNRAKCNCSVKQQK